MDSEHKESLVVGGREPRSFGEELQQIAAAMPDKLLFAILLVAWLALFQFQGNSTFGYANTPSLFTWLRIAYNSSADDDFAYLIPAVIVALLWWKRMDLMTVPKKVWWPALMFFLFAVALHVMGYVIQQPRISVMALFFGFYALMGVLWGWRWLKATLFPLFLLAFLVPLPPDLESMTLPFRLVSTKMSVAAGHLFGINDLAHDGTLIVFPERRLFYEVEAACSGLRSMTVMTAMSCIFAFVSFRSAWKRLLVIIAAAPLAIISNALRLLSIIIAGNWKYDQLKANGLPVEQVRLGAQAFGSYIHDHPVIKLAPYAVAFLCLAFFAKWLRADPMEPEKEAA
jgi:exosortase